MGWSHNRDAGITLDAITEFCVKQTGSQNTYETPNGRYFFDVSRKSHSDGAITATIHKFVGENLAKPSGSLRIEGNGQISRGPACFKKLPKLKIVFTEHRRGQSSRVIELFYREGETTEQALYIEAVKMGQTYAPGGLNEKAGEQLGYLPYPHEVKVIDLQTGDVVGEWKAGMFQVYELPEAV